MSDQEQQPARPIEEIQADLENTRRELGQTVEALGERLDVKTRVTTTARELPGRAKTAATTADGRPKTEVLAGAAAVLVLTVVVVAWRRRR